MNGPERLDATRTARYLIEPAAGKRTDGVELRPVAAAPPGYRSVDRLGVEVTAKRAYNPSALGRGIADAPEEVLFFCDTSLFDARTDPAVWRGLLRREGRMVLVPHVRLELEPWLAAHPEHPAAKAVVAEDPAVWLLDLELWAEPERAAFAYYANLLGFRKRLVEGRLWEFEEAHGRPPDERELNALKGRIQAEVGPRGFLLAKKGAAGPTGPTFFTDEALVCAAAMTAIVSGRPTVILTKDEDVFEQVFKLQWLLDTHYRGMLLADLYADDPFSFVSHALPKDVPHVDEDFVGDNNLLIERPPGWAELILPVAWTGVPIDCWLLGDRFSELSFFAERGMERLLRTKGETGGLNTDRLAGRNCHVWAAPLPLPPLLRNCAVIAADRRLPLRKAPVAIPLHDVQQALMTGERHRRVVEVVPALR